MRKSLWLTTLLSGAILFWTQQSFAQLSIGAQLRTRSELRSGQGAPLSKGLRPAIFTSQRTRIQSVFSQSKLKLGITLQDVRVWGQDGSSINRTTIADNAGLMLHEAWAELLLNDSSNGKGALQLKIGRQELKYDDQRLVGNLDWLQQARRHDAAVLKYAKGPWNMNAAFAFNQNKEKQSGTTYQPVTVYSANTNGGAMYSSLEMLYVARQLNKGVLSFLLLGDQFSRYRMDTVNNQSAKVYQQGNWSRVTFGFHLEKKLSLFGVTAETYYQLGKDQAGEEVHAYMLNLGLQYPVGQFVVGGGVDHSSGGRQKSFDPLYGTPHKFWGAMDYYYAGSTFGKVGLTDYYLRGSWKPVESYLFSAGLHQFNTATRQQYEGRSQTNLVLEADFNASFQISRYLNVEGGYSHYFSTNLLTSSAVKDVSNARKGANWVYVIINITPDFVFHPNK